MDKRIIVIGGGPGGYVAAIKAAKMGAKVTLIEKDSIGGTCLNRGCIPTKTLLHSTELLNVGEEAEKVGIKLKIEGYSLYSFRSNKNDVVKKLVAGIQYLVKSNKIDYLSGTGSFVDKNTVKINMNDGSTEIRKADSIIIATGSKCATIKIPGYDLENVINSDKALELEKVPKDILIMGAGAVGLELGFVYNNLGSKVTIVEMMPEILPTIDSAVTFELEKVFKRKNITLKKEAKVEKIEKVNDKLEVTIANKDSKEKIVVETVLMAAGRAPYTEGLCLENAGVITERGKIVVNDQMQTNVKDIYAIGDAIGGIQLAHVASAEGHVAVDNCFGIENHMNYSVVPSCIYTVPEVASVGLTEKQAKEKNYKVKCGTFSYASCGKAIAVGKTEGLIKIVADETYGEILGVHIIGDRATDIIAEAALAMNLEATVDELASTIHAHPTIAEMFVDAANDVYNKAINK